MTADELKDTFHIAVIKTAAARADWPAVIAWWFSENRPLPQQAFAAGDTRQVAYSLSGLERIAAGQKEQA